jgi:mono/diheme cytochrome c family protein
MYMIDTNVFMNWVLGIILGLGAFVFVLTLALSVLGRTNSSSLMSYLYMFNGIFITFAIVVVILGFRGKKSDNRPWHILLDMKYQPKYTSQGQSKFFADGRSNRLPPENTIPFDGTDYFADAGYHTLPNPDFLKTDRRYFFGIANAEAKAKDKDGVEVLTKPVWKDGKLVGEGYFVNHIPEEAVTKAGGWEQLIKRGQQQFNVNCAVCHGASGRGGGADAAFGVVGNYGLSVAPSNMTTPDIQAQPDGQLFNTISQGVRNMPAYAHQVKVQDRWAIVAYIRVLQYAAGEKK